MDRPTGGETASRFSARDLTELSISLFAREGMPQADARILSESLVAANLRGVDTHGVARIPSYIKRLRTRLVEPAPEIVVASRLPWAASVDGGNGMGAIVGQRAMAEVLARAGTFGIGAATARRSNHFGAAAFYALQAVEQGCIGVALSPASKSLAPFGSREPLFGTNPVAVAVPAGHHPPWVMDMATSVAARGHIRLAARQGQAIPEGWALDSLGQPTTNAGAAMTGVMLPFAGAKGSAIAMLVDILGGVLSGSSFAGAIRDMNVDFEAPQDVGHFFLAMQVEAFMPRAEFDARMETSIARLKALRPAAGFDEVLYPGEPEARRHAERLAKGIPLSREVYESLEVVASSAGLEMPDPVGGPEGPHYI
jgi:LDH2 family malate/lactate/ureidoglycolate dehydrogenase